MCRLLLPGVRTLCGWGCGMGLGSHDENQTVQRAKKGWQRGPNGNGKEGGTKMHQSASFLSPHQLIFLWRLCYQVNEMRLVHLKS